MSAGPFRVRFTGYYWSGYTTRPIQMDRLPELGETVKREAIWTHGDASRVSAPDQIVVGRKSHPVCPCCDQDVGAWRSDSIAEWVIYLSNPEDVGHVSAYHSTYHRD